MSHHFIGIDHVQIAIPEGAEPEARAFYIERLGMTEIAKPGNLRKKGGLWLQAGAQQLHLGVQKNFVGAKKAHPAFEVRGIAEYRHVLIERGVAVSDEDALPGAERFYVYDPFGNRMEFLEWKSEKS